MKKILFPTDFSAAAKNAFVYALYFADKIGAEITTIHAYQSPDLGRSHLPHTLLEVYDSLQLETFEDYKDSIPALRNIAQEHHLEHIPLYHVMRDGEILPVILNLAKANSFDFIIMGTEGTTGLLEIFAGSVAGEVLENANCPVLVVPERATFKGKLERIAITTEFAEDEKKVIGKVYELAKLFGASISCIHVDVAHIESYAHRMDRLQEELADYTGMEFEVLQGLDIASAISKFVASEQVDVLAMLTHKRNFVQELFNYSMTKKMAYHLDTPVLAFQAHTILISLP
ncbi:MAG: universal stress protein [Saprospiraceae bacterium]|nr:universal stress protein [Saprospiraceae bacterium]